MKVRHLFLYLLGIFLLLFSYRDLWDEIREEKAVSDKENKMLAAGHQDIEKRFEVQQLEYDTITEKWSNPTPYFQLVNVSYVNFKALNKNRKTTIESDEDEDASDSL